MRITDEISQILASYGSSVTAAEQTERTRADRYKAARAFQRSLKGRECELAPLDFTGEVTLFWDKDDWNVRLAGGGLPSGRIVGVGQSTPAKTVRLSPRPDSTTAHDLFDLALSRHIEAAAPEMLKGLLEVLEDEWVSDVDRTDTQPPVVSTYYHRQHGTTVHLGLRTDRQHYIYQGAVLDAHLYPSARGLEVHVAGNLIEKLLPAVRAAAEALVASVPEYAGQRVIVVDPSGTEHQPRLTSLSLTEVVPGGRVILTAESGSQVATISLVLTGAGTVKTYSGVLHLIEGAPVLGNFPERYRTEVLKLGLAARRERVVPGNAGISMVRTDREDARYQGKIHLEIFFNEDKGVGYAVGEKTDNDGELESGLVLLKTNGSGNGVISFEPTGMALDTEQVLRFANEALSPALMRRQGQAEQTGWRTDSF